MDYGIQLLNAEDSELSASTSSTAIPSSTSLSSQTQQPHNDKNKRFLKKCKSSLLTQEAVSEREKQKEEKKRLQKEQRNRGESFATGFDGDFGNDDVESYYNSEEDDAAFVLQYSTLNGRRMKKDQVIEDFAIKSVLGDNPVLRLFPQKSNTRLFEFSKLVMSPKVVRVLTICLLSLIFVLPAIWNIFVAFFSYDAIVRNSKNQEPLVDISPTQAEMIPTPTILTSTNSSTNFSANYDNGTVAKNSAGLFISEFSNLNVSTILDLARSSAQFCLNVLLWSSRNSTNDFIVDKDSVAVIFDSKYYYTPSIGSNPESLPQSNQTTKLPIPICFKNFSSIPSSVASQIKNYLTTTTSTSSPSILSAKIYKRDPVSSAAPSSTSIYKTSAFELSWNPYVFAVFCNLIFCILAIVTYHRLEYRRRVAAYMLSYGAILVNRWNWKRVVGALLFCVVLFFACFSTFSVVFGWRYWEAVMANNNNNNNNDAVPTTSDSSANATSIPRIVFDVDFTPAVDQRGILWINTSSVAISNNKTSSSLYDNVSFIVGDDFFLRQIPEISQMISALEILQNQTDSASTLTGSGSTSSPTSTSSTTTTMSSISNFLNKLTSSSSGKTNNDNDGNQQQFSASFMFFVTSLFGALLPYYAILTMIWRRLTTPTIYDQLYFTDRNSQSTRSIFFTLSMMRYMTSSEKAKFQCDIDVAMRAIRLVSFTTPRINDAKEHEEEEDREAGNENKKPHAKKGAVASSSGFSTSFEASYQLLGPGFIFSEFFAAGWITGWSTPWKARRTSKDRPHELFFGSSWGRNEEEANAVLSVLFEHGCLHFLNAQLEDDVHRNKPVLSTEEEEVQRNNNAPTLSVELLQRHDRQEETHRLVVPSAEPSATSRSSNHNENNNNNNRQSGSQHTYFTPANQIQRKHEPSRASNGVDDDDVDNYFQNSSSFVEADDDSQHEINL